MAEEGNDHPANEGNHGDKHDAWNQEVPVARIRGARVCNERYARDNGGEQRHPRRPARNRPLGHKIACGGCLAVRSPKADGHQSHHV